MSEPAPPTPAPRHWSDHLAEWLDPRTIAILRMVGAAIVIILLIAIAYRLLLRGLDRLEQRKRLSPGVTLLFRRVLRWITAALMILMMLQALGVLHNAWAAATAVLTLIGIGFIAVWSVLSNSLCAILLILNRPFEIGDVIEFPGEAEGAIKGKAINFNLLWTTLRADDGALLQVPNNHFFQKPIRRIVGDHRLSLDEQLLKEEDTE